jgi:D-proline reductase (dithiol) PrdB
VVRLADLPEWEREHMVEKLETLKGFDARPWVEPPPLEQCRVALITTAGLHRADDKPFSFGADSSDYRVIPGDTPGAELVMSHLSVNFDRTGFQQDVNIVFPMDRLRELADEGLIGSVASCHYAFMGAASIRDLEPKARQMAAFLKQDQVDAVLLTPV